VKYYAKEHNQLSKTESSFIFQFCWVWQFSAIH